MTLKGEPEVADEDENTVPPVVDTTDPARKPATSPRYRNTKIKYEDEDIVPPVVDMRMRILQRQKRTSKTFFFIKGLGNRKIGNNEGPEEDFENTKTKRFSCFSLEMFFFVQIFEFDLMTQSLSCKKFFLLC